MKVVATTTDDLMPPERGLEADVVHRIARFELLRRLNLRGVYGCAVMNEDYMGEGRFRRHLFPIDHEKTLYEIRGEIKVDALYDKTRFFSEDIPSLTDRAVTMICNDKKLTYEMFTEMQPRTVFIETQEDIEKVGQVVGDGGRVVTKPYSGRAGRGVVIGELEDVKAKISELPVLAQEFIESSGGVPGFTEGRHDVRAIILNGEIVGGLMRWPKEGSLMSNFHLGGTAELFGREKMPDAVREIVKVIDERLPQKARFYAADFFYSVERERWYLIELNGSPGLFADSFGDMAIYIQERLVEELVKMAGDRC